MNSLIENVDKMILSLLRDLMIDSKEWKKEWDVLYKITVEKEDPSYLPVLISKALQMGCPRNPYIYV